MVESVCDRGISEALSLLLLCLHRRALSQRHLYAEDPIIGKVKGS